MEFKIEVFCDTMLCCHADSSVHSKGLSCLHLQHHAVKSNRLLGPEGGDTTPVQNVGNILRSYAALHSRRLKFSAIPL